MKSTWLNESGSSNVPTDRQPTMDHDVFNDILEGKTTLISFPLYLRSEGGPAPLSLSLAPLPTPPPSLPFIHSLIHSAFFSGTAMSHDLCWRLG